MIKVMAETILDNVGADGTMQPLEKITAQMAYYLNGVQRMLAEIVQLRQLVAEQAEKIEKHVETENQLTDKIAALEMKLSGDVAKKSSQEGLLKAVRTFVNRSKQKRIEKRMAVKELLLELANANSIVFPADLAATIDALDDEHSEPKTVTVNGNYNAVHDNGSVGLKE